MGQKVSVQEQCMEMRMTSKRLEKQAQKCLKREAAIKKKVKQAIEQGQMEIAKVRVEVSGDLVCCLCILVNTSILTTGPRVCGVGGMESADTCWECNPAAQHLQELSDVILPLGWRGFAARGNLHALAHMCTTHFT